MQTYPKFAESLCSSFIAWHDLHIVVVDFDEGFSVGSGSLRPDDSHATGTNAQIAKERRYVLLSHETINATSG